MKRSGLSIFYVIMSLFIVIIAGFMLLSFLGMKTEKVCSFEDQGSCCVSIMDKCGTDTDERCMIGACDTPECQNRCGNETYCTLYPGDEGANPHACISEKCLGDISECSPLECTMAAFKYDPSTGKGAGGREWWLVLETGAESRCCQVSATVTGLEKTCAGEWED